MFVSGLFAASLKAENISIPGRKKRKQREKETEGGLDAGPICRTQKSRAMEDVMTVILIVVLFVVLKPIVKAVLKGMGITDRWRDR